MRDKNHPSVIAWSVANEPSSSKSKADKYFKYVSFKVLFLNTLDTTYNGLSWDR